MANDSRPNTGQPTPRVFTLPNLLSFCRIVLGIGFPWIPIDWRLPVLIISAVTDLLDGTLGRLLGATSHTGRLLDPLADKVFVAGVAVTLVWDNTITLWEVLGIGFRDLVVIAGTLTFLALRHWEVFHRMAPTLLSKATTAAQFGFFIVLFWAPQLKEWAFIIATTLSIFSGCQFVWQFLFNKAH